MHTEIYVLNIWLWLICMIFWYILENENRFSVFQTTSKRLTSITSTTNDDVSFRILKLVFPDCHTHTHNKLIKIPTTDGRSAVIFRVHVLMHLIFIMATLTANRIMTTNKKANEWWNLQQEVVFTYDSCRNFNQSRISIKLKCFHSYSKFTFK